MIDIHLAPVILSSWLTARYQASPEADLEINGQPLLPTVNEDWRESAFLLNEETPPTWRADDTTRIGQVSIIPSTGSVSLEEALDIPLEGNIALQTGGDAPWGGESFEGGMDVARSGSVESYQETWLETTAQGPATMRWRWRLQGETGTYSLSLNGEYLQACSHYANWIPGLLELPPGEHVPRWNYQLTSGKASIALLDALEIEPQAQPLGTALGSGSETFIRTGGPGTWTTTSGHTVHPGPLSSQLQLDLEGPGILHLRYKLMAAEGNGLYASVNGSLPIVHAPGDSNTASSTTNGAWETVETLIGEGTHTVSLSYRNRVYPEVPDLILVDEVRVVPCEVRKISLEAAADTGTEVALLTEPDSGWMGIEASISPESPDVLIARFADGETDPTTLTATVEGPAQLSFTWGAQSANLSFRVDGLTLREITHVWREAIFELGEGVHQLEWVATPPSYNQLGAIAYLDAIEITLPNTLPISESLSMSPSDFRALTTDWVIASESHLGVSPSLTTPPGTTGLSMIVQRDHPYELTFEGTLDDGRKWASVYIDGDSVSSLDRSIDGWQTRKIPVASRASHRLDWRFEASEDQALHLGRLNFEDSSPTSLAEGFDSTIALVPTGSWEGIRASWSSDGADCVIALYAPESSAPATLSGQFEGPGALHFHWQGSVKLTINDAQYQPPSTLRNWVKETVWLPEGTHNLPWSGSYSGNTIGETPKLDQVRFEPSDLFVHDLLGLQADRVLVVRGEWFEERDATGLPSLATVPPLGTGNSLTLFPESGEEVHAVLRHGENVIVPTFGSSPASGTADAWVPVRALAPAAPLALWVYAYDEALTKGALRSLSFAEGSLALSPSLDSELVYEEEIAGAWKGEISQHAPDGQDYLTGTGWLQTTITGPGILEFRAAHSNWSINGIRMHAGVRREWNHFVQSLPHGEFVVRWPGGSWLDQVKFRPSASETTYVEWIAGRGLEAEGQLLSANPDHDESNNLLEYAFNLDPMADPALKTLSGREGFLPREQVVSTPDGDYLTVEFLRRYDETLTYHPKFSSDLNAWSPSTASDETITDLGDGWERVIVRDRVRIPDDGRRFGAVDVIKN